MVFVNWRGVYLKRVRDGGRETIIGFARTDLSRFHSGPLCTLDVQTNGSQRREQNNSLESNLLAFIVLWFGSPMEECDHVFGHLGGRSRSAWRNGPTL